MDKRNGFRIVCLVTVLAACSAPRQAAPVLEISPKTEIKFEHTIEIPATVEETTFGIPKDNLDPIFVELENSWLEIQRLQGEKDSILQFKAKVGRKPIYITDTLSIEFETFTVRHPGVDSVFRIINGDTAFHHAYPNNWKLPTAIAEVQDVMAGKRNPFWLFFLAIMALLIRFMKNGEKKK